MEDLKKLKAYFDLLSSLKDGEEIMIGEVAVKREGNRIWESIFIIEPEDEIDENYIEEA